MHEKKKNHFSIDGFALNLPSKQRHVILSKQCRIQTLRYGRGGGGASILLEKGGGRGGLQKNFFSALRASFSSKKYGGGGPPLDPPLLSYTTQDSNSCEGSSFGFIHCFSSPDSRICSNVCPLTNYTVDAFCTKINDNRTCIVIWTSFLYDLSLACTLVFMQITNISRDI